MESNKKLFIAKTVHTFIWAIMAVACFYILYAGILGNGGNLLWVCVLLLLIESLVLAINRWTCPLTPLAARYTQDRRANFDIYLPLWLARYNKQIFGTIFVVGLVMLLLRGIFSWL